jgi:hypothetical protein
MAGSAIGAGAARQGEDLLFLKKKKQKDFARWRWPRGRLIGQRTALAENRPEAVTFRSHDGAASGLISRMRAAIRPYRQVAMRAAHKNQENHQKRKSVLYPPVVTANCFAAPHCRAAAGF